MTMYIILKYPVILSTDATARASTAKVSGWWVVVSIREDIISREINKLSGSVICSIYPASMDKE